MLNKNFDSIYRRLILQQAQEDQNIKKMHQLYLNAMDDQDEAQKNWQAAFNKKRICIFNGKKTVKLRISKFSKSPQRYIKYAQKFSQKDEDELDESHVDQVLAQKKQQIKKVEQAIKQKKVEPQKAKEELKKIYITTKKENPKVAEQIKQQIQKDIKNFSKQTTTKTENGKTITTTKTNYNISGNLVTYISRLTHQLCNKNKKDYLDIIKQTAEQAKTSKIKDLYAVYFIYRDLIKPIRNYNMQKTKIRLRLMSLTRTEKGKQFLSKLIEILKNKEAKEDKEDQQDKNIDGGGAAGFVL